MSIKGTWKLVGFTVYDLNGRLRVRHRDWTGRLTYGPRASMSVVIQKKITPRRLNDVICYAGTYFQRGDAVIHNVKVSSDAKLMGKQLRFPRLDRNFLILRTPSNKKTYAEITWKRSS